MSVDPQGHTHPERPAAEDPTAGGGAATAAQALLSSDLSESLNRLAASALAGPATIYDKALDANYLNPLLRPDLGGNYHRLFDGGHTIAGAAKAVHAATPDDTIIEEALGTVGALLKDAVTPRGLPIRTWDKASFDTTAAALGDRFGIPKSWLYDINTYDVADVCAAAVGTVAVIFGWNRADTETFAQITASAGVSAVAAANPLLVMVTVAALARAFHKARRGDDYTALLDGGVKGAVGSATMLAAVAAVGAAGGSAGIGLLAGVTAGVLAHKATKHVTLSAVSRFVVDAARDMADRAQFELLADAWYADTMVSSSSTEMYGHDAYRQIIAMGETAVPLILAEMRVGHLHWGAALTEITGEAPDAKARSPKAATEAWLAWAHDQGLTADSSQHSDEADARQPKRQQIAEVVGRKSRKATAKTTAHAAEAASTAGRAVATASTAAGSTAKKAARGLAASVHAARQAAVAVGHGTGRTAKTTARHLAATGTATAAALKGRPLNKRSSTASAPPSKATATDAAICLPTVPADGDALPINASAMPSPPETPVSQDGHSSGRGAPT